MAACLRLVLGYRATAIVPTAEEGEADVNDLECFDDKASDDKASDVDSMADASDVDGSVGHVVVEQRAETGGRVERDRTTYCLGLLIVLTLSLCSVYFVLGLGLAFAHKSQ